MPPPPPFSSPLLDLLDNTVRGHAGAVAVADDRGHLTYERLWSAAAHTAARLTGAGLAGRPVLLALPPGTGWVTGLLGAWRAGSAAVPLDLTHPPHRLSRTATASGATGALTPSGTAPPWAPQLAALAPSGPGTPTPPCRSGGGPGGEAVACIWHTSGTTGTPKPVAVPHQAVAARARALPAWTGITHSDRIAQITSTGFDAVLWEVLGALTTGARLQTAGPADRIAGPALAGFLARHKITALTCTPSTLSATPFTELPALRRIVLGGEALHPRPLAAWIARYDVANAYGPTEACVEALVSDHITPGHDHPVPIGRPLPGVHAWILDHRHRPVAPGQAGELYLGGDGLATGYPGHPEETAAAFLHLDLPTPAGMRRERVYRTGDRARQTAPGGEFVYLGRCDHQLNPGGVRLEPLEVETTATTLPGVRAAALLVQHGRLVLHAEADDDPGLAGRLRAHLADRLPPPAVPAVIVRHDRLPRTASGKTDRHALTLIPAPTAPVPQTGAPTAGLAGEAAQWWQELTGTPPGGRDFFADGGTSLAALVLIQRVNEHHGTQIVIGAFTADPTPGFLARTLNPEGDCS